MEARQNACASAARPSLSDLLQRVRVLETAQELTRAHGPQAAVRIVAARKAEHQPLSVMACFFDQVEREIEKGFVAARGAA